MARACYLQAGNQARLTCESPVYIKGPSLCQLCFVRREFHNEMILSTWRFTLLSLATSKLLHVCLRGVFSLQRMMDSLSATVRNKNTAGLFV
ncbi:hypothetical protein TNCV_2823671 [Trichonephila clavipes]|nr:hypothetical protein TNCV_2823671 [Trichonephila clavipes]